MQLVDRELFTNCQLEWDLSTVSAEQKGKEYPYGRTENISFFLLWEVLHFRKIFIYSYIIYFIGWDPVLTSRVT